MKDPMSIFGHTTFPNITPENRGRFEEVAARLLELGREETGVLAYDWYWDPTGTKCVIREEFADSEAILTHIEQCKDVIPQAVELGGGLSVQLFGTMTDEVAEAMSQFGAEAYIWLQGLGQSTPR
jgi:quinol monooxygenase YgiN